MTDTAQASTSPPAGAGAVARDNELVAFTDCDLIDISDELTLVINRQNGNQQVITPQVVAGLKTLSEFNTLQAHAAHLASTRPELGGQQAMAATALQDLRDAGMLLRAGDICTRLAQPTPHPLPPTRAFVFTCDRPAAVERLLDSMLRSARMASHDAMFLVDDSRDPANREANREAVIRFNMRSAKDMFYVGEQAQAELLDGLTAALPEHANGIRFLLDPARWTGKKTYGRGRTLCLLWSVGYRALLMDDDILCQAVLPPVREPGIGFGSSGLRKAGFFPDQQALMQSGAVAEIDPLNAHANLLGTNLGHALHRLNAGPLLPPQLQHVNAALANVLRADSPVLVTQCGSLGDPGTQSRHWVMYQSEDSIERLLSAPHGMSAALNNGLNWLGSSRPNILKVPVMSQLTGLDNSRVLPPYFPAFRGEDLLFGAMMTALHPEAVALDLAWSVPHLRLEERPTTPSPIAAGGMSVFARHLTTQIDFHDSTNPLDTLAQLSREALAMAALPDQDLLVNYRAELAAAQADQLHQLQMQFERTRHLGSREWQDYLQRGIEEIQQALASVQSPTRISGVTAGASESELLGEFRPMAQGFGEALAGWAQVRDVAAGLTDAMISSRSVLPR